MRKRRELFILLAILAFGVVLRVVYYQDLKSDPLFASPAFDAQLHDYWAWGLASGDWSLPPRVNDPRIETTPFFRPPGYPYFLSLIYRILGHDAHLTRLAQFAIGLMSAVVVFLFARRRFGQTVGLITAGFTTLYWTFIFFEGELLDPVLLVLLLPAMIFALASSGERMTPWRGALAGILLGMAALVRPNVLLFVPFACLWLVWVDRRSDGGTRRWLPTVAALVLGTVVAIAPATIRNYRVSGEWVLISANGGVNLFIGNNPRADGIRAVIPDVDNMTGGVGWTCFDYPQVMDGLSRRLGRPVSYSEASRIWSGEALKYIASNPGHFLGLTAKRAALFWGPGEVGDRDVQLARNASPVLRRIPMSFPFLLSLAILGTVIVFRDWRRVGDDDASETVRYEVAMLVVLFVAVYSASFLPFFFNARYRVPLLPFLGLLAAFSVHRFARLVLDRELARAVGWAAACVALFALASIDFAGYRPQQDEWHFQRGNAFRDQGNVTEAENEFRAALDLNPRHRLARNNLGVLLQDQGRDAEAIRELQDGLRAVPDDAFAHFNLAGILAERGDLDGAIEQYRTGLEDNPTNVEAHMALGRTLVMRGATEAGLDQYLEVLALRPEELTAHLAVGRLLLFHGRTEDAVRQLREAVRLAPTDARTHLQLARALEASGRMIEATQHYDEAIRLDPQLGREW